jgi:hypothetical protein
MAGMWFTVSPWRLRDLIQWATANESRVRVGSGFRLALGALVLILGLTVFRAGDAQAHGTDGDLALPNSASSAPTR